jgi:hypothetical protein
MSFKYQNRFINLRYKQESNNISILTYLNMSFKC